MLGCARSFEAALNHVVSLELLAAERSPDGRLIERPPVRERSQDAEPEPKTRRTIDIVGDPDKPTREPASEHPSPTAGEDDDTEDPGRHPDVPEPSGSA